MEANYFTSYLVTNSTWTHFFVPRNTLKARVDFFSMCFVLNYLIETSEKYNIPNILKEQHLNVNTFYLVLFLNTNISK